MQRLLVGAVVALLTSLALAPAASAVSDDIVISEFRTRGPVGGNDEFIELRNRSGGDVSIAGWKLQGCASGGGAFSDRATVPAGVTLAAGQSYLFTNSATSGGPYSGAVSGDQTYGSGITDFATNNSAGIRVLDAAAAVVDGVGSPISPCREGTGFVTPGANDDNSFERLGGVLDTDDNDPDFDGPKAGNPQNRAGSGPPADAAPTVASTDPDDGESGVSPDSSITVTFSEPVNAAPGAFSLSCTDGNDYPVTVTTTDQTTYTVDPATDLPQAQCTLTIDGASVRDADANDPPDTMVDDHETSFLIVGVEGLRIHDIQGQRHLSPYAGTTVAGVPGVVTARRNNGFFIQDSQTDADDKTSEGLFVFTSIRPRDEIAVGKAVNVSGIVTEFRGATNALGLTQISAPSVTVTGDGAAIAPTLLGRDGRVPPRRIIDNDSIGDVDLNPFFDPKQDGIDFYESVEGMLVRVNQPYAVGPTASFGEIPVVADGGRRAGPFTARGGLRITPRDFNPERMHLDDEVLRALSPAPTAPFMPPADVGDTISDVQAVVDYSFGNFKLQVTSQPGIVEDGGLMKETTQSPGADELAVGSFNVENLTPLGANPSPAQQVKYRALAQTLVDRMKAPDIVAVEEIQDNNGTSGGANSPVVDASETWRSLITAIDGYDNGRGPTYDYRQIDPVAHQDGGAPGGNIRVGFLFRTDRGLDFVDRGTAGPLDATQVVDTNNGPQLTLSPGRIQPTDDAWLASRKPLAGEFRWRGETVIAVANHFASKGGDDPLFGHRQPPVRHTEIGPDGRHRQATLVNEFVHQVLAADKKANVVVLGDINDFDFSETTEILESRGALTTLYRLLPKRERYSYVFEGNSQVLDQILVSPEVLKSRPEFDSVHTNAEFADQTSDHDPQVARIELDDHGH
jgi:uncharacterized protein